MFGMRKRAAATAVYLMLLPGVQAQRAGSSTLVVHVMPEARVAPSGMTLQFQVSGGGGTTQGATVTAWVRAPAGTQIRLQARLTALNGPDGAVAGATVVWSGATAQSTGGGRQANCISGAFANANTQDMVQGWRQSGTVQCAVTFQLAQPGTLTPGVYTGTVEFGAGAN